MSDKRKIKKELSFKEEGTFQSVYAAEAWLNANGYSFGSACKDRKTGVICPIAIVYGPYELPEKWINMDDGDKILIDGIMTSNDWREGEVKIILYEKSK